MNIPKEVKIGGFIVNVEFVDNLIVERRHCGEYNGRTNIITIDKAISQQQKEDTFIHELLEAITSIYDIDMDHKDLSNMATVLYQIIKDNPGIFG